MKGFPKKLSYLGCIYEPSSRPLGEGRFHVHVDGRGIEIDAGRIGEQGFYFCDEEGGRHRAFAAWTGRELWLRVDGRTWKLTSASPEATALDIGLDPSRVEAPMTGRIVKLLVQAGASVEEGEDLIILTAMKMEHRLQAMVAGEVLEILCSEAETVEAGALLLRLST